MTCAKRQRAFILACFVVILSVFPVKRSEAFVPPGAVAAASVFGGPIGMAVAIGAVAVGMTLMYLTISDASDNAVRIPLSENSISVIPPPNAPPTETQSPAVYGNWYSVGVGNLATRASSRSGACTAAGGIYYSGSNTCRLTSSQCSAVGYSSCYEGVEVFVGSNSGVVDPASCPSGYTVSGSSCILSAPRKVTDDKTCDLLLAGGQFATADDLNCSSTVDGSKIAPLFRDGKAIAYGLNEATGQPLMWQVSPGSGQTTVTQYEQIQTATQTQVKATTAVIDSATGQVISVSTSTSPGNISSPSASTVPSVNDPVAQPVSPVNTPTVTTDGTKTADIQFPSDYARRGESQSAADSLKPSIDGVKDKLTDSVDVVDPTVPEWADGWDATFNPLKAWSMPGHSSVCPTGAFSWNGSVYLFDAHCQLFADYWSTLQSAAVVVWTVAALFILLGA